MVVTAAARESPWAKVSRGLGEKGAGDWCGRPGKDVMICDDVVVVWKDIGKVCIGEHEDAED